MITTKDRKYMKIWQKEGAATTDVLIEQFTVGRDRELDLQLAPFDVLGSMAHAVMLEQVGLLTSAELAQLLAACKEIYEEEILRGAFGIADEVEDVHSQVEWQLTQRLGDVGKKIHSGRSRNDQVLVDIKMYMRQQLKELIAAIQQLFGALQQRSEQHKADLLPGYTHLQIAMPSSFGLWFGAYAESLLDDVEVLRGAYRVVNKNPLGSGAGYGSSFPLDRHLTTRLLGFERPNYNVVYAQMTRGKTESVVLMALANLAATLGRLAMDVCLYNSQNFGFVKLPAAMTTGSSIMPHKKNPDVAEILRGKANRLKGLPTEMQFLLSNLPSGYHRDLQLTKEILMPAFGEVLECVQVATYMIQHLEVTPDLLQDPTYDLLFSVENVNELVVQGVPFRDAYRQVGGAIERGDFEPNRRLSHTLLGSIGHLATNEIAQAMADLVESFKFQEVDTALAGLLARA